MRNFLCATLAVATLVLSGCVYRLQPRLLSQQRLIIVARSPDRYAIRVREKDYLAGPDGKVAFDILLGGGCDVYLFNRIPVSRRRDQLKAKTIAVVSAGRVVHLLSRNDISKLPLTAMEHGC